MNWIKGDMNVRSDGSKDAWELHTDDEYRLGTVMTEADGTWSTWVRGDVDETIDNKRFPSEAAAMEALLVHCIAQRMNR